MVAGALAVTLPVPVDAVAVDEALPEVDAAALPETGAAALLAATAAALPMLVEAASADVADVALMSCVRLSPGFLMLPLRLPLRLPVP